MNSSSWLYLLNLLIETPRQLNEIKVEKQAANECLINKLCIAVWDKSNEEWLVYRLEHLKEACGESLAEKEEMLDQSEICRAYYSRVSKKKSN